MVDFFISSLGLIFLIIEEYQTYLKSYRMIIAQLNAFWNTKRDKNTNEMKYHEKLNDAVALISILSVVTVGNFCKFILKSLKSFESFESEVFSDLGDNWPQLQLIRGQLAEDWSWETR